MTVEISPVVLVNVATGKQESAELWDAITEAQLKDWDTLWFTANMEAMVKLKQAGLDPRSLIQSSHWNWRKKASGIEGLLGAIGFSLMCEGVTQGMMTLDMGSKRCRIDSQRGMHLVYIDYVENAPWNRKELLYNPPRYRGVGSIFIRTAIEVSFQEGFKGRIGLHSLPQAEGFYTKCGMTDMGKDTNYYNLRYFEMTIEQAESFIKLGGES